MSREKGRDWIPWAWAIVLFAACGGSVVESSGNDDGGAGQSGAGPVSGGASGAGARGPGGRGGISGASGRGGVGGVGAASGFTPATAAAPATADRGRPASSKGAGRRVTVVATREAVAASPDQTAATPAPAMAGSGRATIPAMVTAPVRRDPCKTIPSTAAHVETSVRVATAIMAPAIGCPATGHSTPAACAVARMSAAARRSSVA
jgi:hypothetical protein